MTIHLKELHIAYNLIPYKRNQDVVRLQLHTYGWDVIISMVDGYDSPDLYEDNKKGRKLAKEVSRLYPFLFVKDSSIEALFRARRTAEAVDLQILSRYEQGVACVAAFVFQKKNKQILVTVGSVFAYLWDGRKWFKPKEIGDYSLEPRQYGSDVSRFFGGKENKNKPLFSCQPDVVETDADIPVFLATDGFEDVFSLKDLNAFTAHIKNRNPKVFIEELTSAIKRNKKQKDDITILLKGVPKIK